MSRIIKISTLRLGYLLLVELVQPLSTLLLIIWNVLHRKTPGCTNIQVKFKQTKKGQMLTFICLEP